MANILTRESWGENPVTRKTTAHVGSGTIIVSHIPEVTPPKWMPVGTPVTSSVSVITGPVVQPIQYSQDSGFAPFETIYCDFELEAQPTYNFWVEDEKTNDSVPLGDRKLDDVPRYIRLVWNPAPDIKDPAEFGKIALGGTGSATSAAVIVDGITFNPTILQEVNIQLVADLLSNGHLAPGVLETVVEIHTGTVTPPPTGTSANVVDEDNYLAKQGFWGIPYSEFLNVVWNRRSQAYGAQVDLFGLSLSGPSYRDRQFFVDGAYGLVRPDAPGGVIWLQSTDANSPIGFAARTCYSKRSNFGDRVHEYLDMTQPNSDDETRAGASDLWDYNRVKAKFVHTNMMGVVDPARVAAIQLVHQAEATTAIAQNLQNLVTYNEAGMQSVQQQITIPSFNSPRDVKPVEYIGYIIEKYAFESNAFVLKDTFYVPGNDAHDYVDTQVRYGVAYRYRVRAILRWTRPRGIGVLGKDPTVVDATGSNINTVAPNQSSFWGSEWSKNWATAILIDMQQPDPPDELTVRPDSRNESVTVTFRVPYNPQLDINKMVLWRRLADESGREITNWEQVQEYGPENARYVDSDVKFVQEGGYRYLYAATCHTKHGETSVLSDQLSARLNKDWARTGEFPVEFVSCAGVDKDKDTGLFSTYPERRLRSELIVKPDTTVPAPARFQVTGQMRVGSGLLNDNNYVLRIESLDNGQSVEAPVTVAYDNLPIQTLEEDSNVLVPDTGY